MAGCLQQLRINLIKDACLKSRNIRTIVSPSPVLTQRIQSSCQNKLNISSQNYLNFYQNIFKSSVSNAIIQRCNFSTSSRQLCEKKQERKLELMNTPLVVTPSIFTSIQNYFIYFFLVPKYDKDFTIQGFCKNSIKALEVVTKKLSGGMLDELKGLFTDECLDEISTKFPSLSLKERHHLLILEEKIHLYFPFLIKLIHLNDRVFMEVSMCYYMYYGERATTDVAEQTPYDPMKFVFANCKFIREYTEGVEDDWTINYLNYGYSNQILQKEPDS